MESTVRMGSVGIGNMGSAHAASIWDGKVPGMKLAAVCDSSSERRKWAETRFSGNIPVFENYQDMISSALVDAVLIAVPHRLHPVIAVDAFRAGLHVLTEKPAGIDTANVERMNTAARESGKIFGIMYNQRTNPLYQKLRELVKNGELGELQRSVWIISNWYRTQAYYDSGDWRATWAEEGGGVLLNQCPHNLDLWQWILGMPVKVRAFLKTGHYHEIQVEDDGVIYAEYANGASGVFITSTGEYPGTNRLEVSGTRGKAVVENGELRLTLLKQDIREITRCSAEGAPKAETISKIISQEAPETGHIGILCNFAEAVLNGTPLLAPGEEGIRGLMISNAAYLSQWKDDWTELPVNEALFARFLEEKQQAEQQKNRAENRQDREKLYGNYNRRWSIQW